MLMVYLSVAGRGTNKKTALPIWWGCFYYAYLINMCAGYVEKCAYFNLTHHISASGQNRNMTVTHESGLYSLIMSSKHLVGIYSLQGVFLLVKKS